ncbi:MAG TPA: Holliday junction branch migration DNA helicase RuvB [Terriglobia bacterium]|nr:Holliday junction branch migration DNA helicase RuvB [Terriglobia bacterium]
MRIKAKSEPTTETKVGRNRLVAPGPTSKEDEKLNQSLRPPTLDDYVGQKGVVEKLKIALEAAKQRHEPLEHVLFHGPPGLGKTTLANIIANWMKSNIITTSGPALERTHQLMGVLTNLSQNDVLFIDEIHRLPVNIEEFLYPAMEDFRLDIPVDKGPYAKITTYHLKKFTLVGATTRAGTVSAPLRNRFGLSYHLNFYPEDDLKQIVLRSADILRTKINKAGAAEIAHRARGTPRIANRLLRRVRDFAQVKRKGLIGPQVAAEALDLEGVDQQGLDALDYTYLRTIIQHYQGGPVGVEALSATLNEEVDTLVDMVEPFLLQQGFISRTKSGRRANEPAYKHLGIRPPNSTRGVLLYNSSKSSD